MKNQMRSYLCVRICVHGILVRKVLILVIEHINLLSVLQLCMSEKLNSTASGACVTVGQKMGLPVM